MNNKSDSNSDSDNERKCLQKLMKTIYNLDESNNEEYIRKKSELLEHVEIQEENIQKCFEFYSQINDKISINRYIDKMPHSELEFYDNEIRFETNSKDECSCFEARYCRKLIVFDFPKAILFTPDAKYKFNCNFTSYLIEKKFNIPTKDQDLIIEQHNKILPILTFYKEIDSNAKIEWYKKDNKPEPKIIFKIENTLYVATTVESCETAHSNYKMSYSILIDNDYITLSSKYPEYIGDKKIKRKLNYI